MKFRIRYRAYLIFQCLHQVFLQYGKTAIITPIFKSGSPNEGNNYRPISLTWIASTIIETIIKDIILDHLNKYKLISSTTWLPGSSLD